VCVYVCVCLLLLLMLMFAYQMPIAIASFLLCFTNDIGLALWVIHLTWMVVSALETHSDVSGSCRVNGIDSQTRDTRSNHAKQAAADVAPSNNSSIHLLTSGPFNQTVQLRVILKKSTRPSGMPCSLHNIETIRTNSAVYVPNP